MVLYQVYDVFAILEGKIEGKRLQVKEAQADLDHVSCFFVCAASVHRFLRRYHVKTCVL